MIQTILITALSAQLTYLNPITSPTPSTPRVSFTRVLPMENTVSHFVKKTSVKHTIIQLPELQKDIMTNDQLQEPTSKYAAVPTISVVFIPIPTATPTPTVEPTVVFTVITPIVTQAPIAVSNTASSISDEAITYLGNCEAGMDPAKNTGNGYYGAFQFSYGTWQSLNTGYTRADLAPIEVQEAAVKQLLQRSSIYTQFPACAQKMHGAGLL